MTPRTRDVLQMAVEAGVTSGIRRGWKHTDEPWPTQDQHECITDAVIQAIDEWFIFEETM